jgi:hypothetical protein
MARGRVVISCQPIRRCRSPITIEALSSAGSLVGHLLDHPVA